MDAFARLHKDLNQNKKQLIASCSLLLKVVADDLIAAILKFDINSLNHLVQHQSRETKPHIIRVKHPEHDQIFRVDASQLKDNYLAIFIDYDRHTVLKFDRLLKIKRCLSQKKNLAELAIDLKGIMSSDIARQEIMHQAHTNVLSSEASLLALSQKFLVGASLLASSQKIK